MDIQELRIIGILQGYSTAYLLYTACELGIFNELYKNNISLDKLSRILQIEKEILYRLIRPLIGLNFIIKNEEVFQLTALGERLAKDNDNSLERIILFSGRECMACWAKMYEAIKKNTVPYILKEELDFFNVHAEDDTKFQCFHEMMGGSSMSLDFSSYYKHIGDPEEGLHIVDVGGGAGEILSKFLGYFTHAVGTIIDLKHLKKIAEDNLKLYDLSERCTFQIGNFFEPIKVKGDVYILSRILHDWEDEKAAVILRNIRNSMEKSSKLLIIEKIVPIEINSKNLPFFMNDLHIWSVCGGKERTEEEFSMLLKEAELYIKKIVPLAPQEFILEVGVENS